MPRLGLLLGGVLLAPFAGRAEGDRFPVFRDRREPAGVTFKHRSGRTGDKYLIETMGGGAAVIDYDNDGRLDLFFVNGGGLARNADGTVAIQRSRPEYFNRLYRNNGDGTFAEVAQEAGVTGAEKPYYGMGAATGDYNNDGFTDLYVTHYGGATLLRNNGDGTFADATDAAGANVSGWSASAGFFDYDRDGDLDLFVTRYLDWSFAQRIACGESFRVYCTPKKYGAAANVLLRNNGDGTFADVSAASGIGAVAGKALGVAFNDYDGDGWTDICVANDSTAQFLFRNRGDGTFAEQALETGLAFNEDGGIYSGMGIDFADYDNDGKPDVLITNLAKELYALYRNDGPTGFTYLTRQSRLATITARLSGWGVRLADFDNDGWKDLFVAQGHVLDNIERIDESLVYRQPPLLARNIGGRFEDVSDRAGDAFSRDAAGRGAAFGDLDNDGDIDAVIGVLDNRPLVLYNNASEGKNNWLTIELVAARSAPAGAGAIVSIAGPDGAVQRRFASTAGSYLSANDPRIHFGLGTENVVETLEVQWPSGTVQTLRKARANRLLTITEPQE